MGVLPVINCVDSASVKSRIETVKKFLPEGSFLHVDIADAAFTFHRTWNDPKELAPWQLPYLFEVHLMTEHPEDQIDSWITANARRFIVHSETLIEASIARIMNLCAPKNIGLALSLTPETTIDRIAPVMQHFSMVQVLAVRPGLPGQAFIPSSVEKIKTIKKAWPRVIIEVDGGMNIETAKLVKDAGADFIVSESFIINNQNPGQDYDFLRKV
jgi:ribulose-phosphate 3-epimerase